MQKHYMKIHQKEEKFDQVHSKKHYATKPEEQGLVLKKSTELFFFESMFSLLIPTTKRKEKFLSMTIIHRKH